MHEQCAKVLSGCFWSVFMGLDDLQYVHIGRFSLGNYVFVLTDVEVVVDVVHIRVA